MHPWQNIKSYKRYGLKTLTSDEVGHMFTFLHNIAKPLAENFKMHQQPAAV